MNLFFSNFSRLMLSIKFLIVLFVIIAFSSKVNSTTITITVQSNFFNPNNVSVSVGDTIKYQWVDGFHTATCDGVFPGTSLPPGAATFDAQMNSGTPVFLYPVTVAGTYNYVCVPHSPSMAGTFVATGGSGGVLFTENFSYPAGDSIGAHGWNWNTGTANTIFVTEPGLTYTGYPLSGIGNKCHLRNNGNDAYKNMTSADSTGSLYCSFMVKVDSVRQPGDYFLALISPTSTTNYTARFHVKDSSGALAFGISKSTAAMGIFYTSGAYSLGTTYLVVIKYTFLPGTNDDVISVYILTAGVPATEPGIPTIGPFTGTANDATIGRIALRQGSAVNGPTLDIDGIQIAKSWSNIATGITNVSTTVPQSFSLSQNYPNPFNPNTTIKFSISERGFADLTVYNSIGLEVENLVKENVNEGVYSVNFNGSGLNSGVYFYKLNFTNQEGLSSTDTKKLILIK